VCVWREKRINDDRERQGESVRKSERVRVRQGRNGRKVGEEGETNGFELLERTRRWWRQQPGGTFRKRAVDS